MHLGSDSDPTEPGIANLIVVFGISPWPCTLGLARVHIAPNQKICSITQVMESARECFSGENGLDMPHYYLTPVYTEAPYILSDAGLQAADGSAMVIGVATVGINLKDNTVDLAASEVTNIYSADTLPPAPQDKPCFGTTTALLSHMDQE